MIARTSLLIVLILACACSAGSSTVSLPARPIAPGISLDAAAAPSTPVDAEVAAPNAAVASADAAGVDDAEAPDGDEASDGGSSVEAGLPQASAAPEEEAWCPPDIETLPGPICAVVPEQGQADAPAPRTLVVFLHGVTNVGSEWQIALIQGMARYAKQHDFALLAPRAPRQPHVAGKDDVYAWRTSTLSSEGEEALLNGWMDAKAELEGRLGQPFAQVFVMGFSSGAYYASSLALRGRLAVDGYAVFAGGSAPYSRRMMAGVKTRAPVFVGYGLRDRTARRDAQGLVRALRAARWKHRVLAAPKAGHTITTRQFVSALAFLRAESGAAAGAAPPASAQPAAPGKKDNGPRPGRRPRRRGGSKHRVP